MDDRRFSIKLHDSILLFGQVVIIVLCFFSIFSIYTNNIFPDKNAEATYQKVDCLIKNKQMQTKKYMATRYRPQFLVSYEVKGINYNSWVGANGHEASFGSDKVSEENVLNQYNIGKTYSCWYNPDDPKQVILIFRHDWTSVFPLIVPAVILMITIYYFFRTLLHLLFISRRKVL